MESIVEPQRRKERKEGAKAAEPSQWLNDITRHIVDSAFAVHRTLGPGLLESVYERCLAYELEKRGLPVARQVMLPIRYEKLFVEAGFRLDMVVGDCVVVEIKSVEQLLPIHEAQLLTYLKMANHKLGLLINFNVLRIKDGVRRLVQSR